jgi:hypothetical protein
VTQGDAASCAPALGERKNTPTKPADSKRAANRANPRGRRMMLEMRSIDLFIWEI